MSSRLSHPHMEAAVVRPFCCVDKSYIYLKRGLPNMHVLHIHTTKHHIPQYCPLNSPTGTHRVT